MNISIFATMKNEQKPYMAPSIRSVPVRIEDAFLTASTEPIPVEPFDPEFE